MRDQMLRLIFTMAVVTAICGFNLISPAFTHQAPSGFTYPAYCCSNRDCQPIPDGDIAEMSRGYLVKTTGELIPWGDARIRDSPDGRFHLCRLPGQTKTRCLIAPPRSM